MRLVSKFFVLVALVSFAFAAQAETVRYIFKGPQFGARQLTFGLSQEQAQQIHELSGIRMDDVYFVDADISLYQEMKAKPGFSSMLKANVPPPGEVVAVEGDPEFTSQWWVESLEVKKAWLSATGAGVVVADCDAGFYHEESDLKANFLLDYRYDLSNTLDPLTVSDGPYAYHGTAVTAILAGVMDGAGTNGIAYNAKIVPLQNFNYDNTDKLDKEEATAKCILKAIETPDVDIIVLENQTFEGSSETFVGTRDAVRLAQQSGIIVVGAGGNYSTELTIEAGDDTGSIIVGALAQNGTSASWSNFGARVTVGAYGENLLTLFGPNGAFGEFGGTSGATPQVAAAVAMMKEVNPGLTPAMARQILLDTREVNATNERTGGRLRIPEAIEAAKVANAPPLASAKLEVFRSNLVSILKK